MASTASAPLPVATACPFFLAAAFFFLASETIAVLCAGRLPGEESVLEA